MELKVNGKYTVISISESTAMTRKMEITITNKIELNGKIGYEYKLKGKRTSFALRPKDSSLILEGWDIPIKADTDCAGVWRGNACLNLVGDIDTARFYIDNKNLNEGLIKGKILLVNPSDSQDTGITILYPDEAGKLGHAVIDRYLMKQERGCVCTH